LGEVSSSAVVPARDGWQEVAAIRHLCPISTVYALWSEGTVISVTGDPRSLAIPQWGNFSRMPGDLALSDLWSNPPISATLALASYFQRSNV
jgi:hypothetical protein